MAKIGIIGGGFAGLGTAYYLKKYLGDFKENEVTILEYGDSLGGLASGIKTKEWEWPVDRFIHHWFTNDKYALGIAKEIGMEDKLIIKDTKSYCYYKGKFAELDSPVSLIKFPFIPLFDRIRTGITMGILKIDNNYARYENETSFSFIRRMMGEKSFKVIWEPLFLGKFGDYADKVNAAWFWARVNPRTKDLAYIEGGFQGFANKIGEVIEEAGGNIQLNVRISKIEKKKDKFQVSLGKKKLEFDHLVLAVPLPVALQLYNFPKEYKEKISPLKSIGAQYFVLELEKPFLSEDIYWLNVNEKDFPFMMVAEHTNFIDKKHYDNKHIVWVGKYLDYDHPLWKLPEKELLEEIIPYLKKINPKFEKSWIKRSFFSRAKNCQPILPLGYSKKIPGIKTPVENLYIANMNHVYPFDRGTNQALEVGMKAAKIIRSQL